MVLQKVHAKQNLRLNTLFITFFIVLMIFIARLFSIQVLNHGKYTAQAQDQYWNLSVIPAKRGDVISADNFILAGTQTHYLLFAEPKKVANTYEVAHRLSEVLTKYEIERINDIKPEELQEKKDSIYKLIYDDIYEGVNSNLYWTVLQHNITPVQKEEIEELQLAGIGFEEEPVRYYPEGSLASHVLGFVAFNEQGEKQGYFGIEGKFNDDLKGKPGRVLEERDALGNPILVGSYKKSESIKGRDIVLSINRSVQFIVEKSLKNGVENYNAKSGSVIVMDPFTGEIVAMANYPSYDPDNFNFEEVIAENTERKNQERKNLCITETYEPGSVIKPLTVSSAIELGKVTPETTFDDRGPVQYSDYIIDNWDGKHHGIQTVTQLLEKSNNIGAAWVGHQVGGNQLSKFFSEFGIGRKTDIELEGEDTGSLREAATLTDIDVANISFGQGVSATPLQVLNSFNAIANGGFLLQPKIVNKVIDGEKVIETPTKQVKRVISKGTSETMVNLLENAASSGEAKYFVLKNYRIAGKTGTAQIPVGGKYDPEKTNATFVGFLAGTKKFSMIVRLEEPQSSIFAAETAVPLWMEIASELVKYYGIAPDREVSSH